MHKGAWFPSTATQTLSRPATHLIPTSVSWLPADRTQSCTCPFTRGALHHAFLLVLRPVAQEGCGSTMVSYPALSITPSSLPPSALLVQTRVAQSLASQSAITIVPSSFSTLTCAVPRVSMVLPSGSMKQARYDLMCP